MTTPHNASIRLAAGHRQRIPHLAEYLGFWAMEPKAFEQIRARASTLNIDRHLEEVARVRMTDAGEMVEGSERPDAQQGDSAHAPYNRVGDFDRYRYVKNENDPKASQAERRRVDSAYGYGYSYVLDNGIATLNLDGMLMKHVSSLDDGSSTVMARRTIRDMMNNDAVAAVILCIDSPGGTVSGTYDLVDDIFALAAKKPVHAYGEDLMCSAAYAIACGCRSISCNRTAIVGSIGTYGVVYDYTGWFKKQGIKAHLIASGGMKGAGVPGTKVTDEQLNEWEKEILLLNQHFVETVAKGRKISTEKAAALADGRVYVGQAAVEKGMVDRVESLDSMVARVRSSLGGTSAAPPAPPQRQQETAPPAQASADAVEPTQTHHEVEQSTPGADARASAAEPAEPQHNAGGEPPAEGVHMDPKQNAGNSAPAPASNPQAGTETPQAARPATIPELEQACPGAASDFILAQAKAGATVQAAQTAHMQILAAENKALKEKQNKPGPAGANRAVATRNPRVEKQEGGDDAEADTGDPVADFNAAVSAHMSKPGFAGSRKQAVLAVAKKSPELHQSFLAATNPGRKQQALLAEKYES